jgi:hypothetical protein
VVGTDRREVSVRKVLAERLGAEVQIQDYAVVKTTLRTNTSDTNEWIQESRQILQSRADPSRRVQMDIRCVSCRVVSCRVVSCRVVSCRVVSCRVVSRVVCGCVCSQPVCVAVQNANRRNEGRAVDDGGGGGAHPGR